VNKLILVIMSLIFILSACSGRDLSNVKTSLYGHWIDEKSATQYYISEDSIIQVNEEGQKDKTYKVLDYDEVMNMIVFYFATFLIVKRVCHPRKCMKNMLRAIWNKIMIIEMISTCEYYGGIKDQKG